MDRILQIFCDLLGDLGVSTDALQQEFIQCLDTYPPYEQKILADQFIAQLKIVFQNATDDKTTQTEPEEDIDERPSKRSKVDPQVNRNNVQINATKEELDKRIAAFMALKAAENNESNLMEFCKRDGNTRTDPATIKRKQQIKLSKNESQEGPLNTTHSSSSSSENGNTNNAANTLSCHGESSIGYRIWSILLKSFIPLLPNYERIKALEDKLLLMEDSGFLKFLEKKKSGKGKKTKADFQLDGGAEEDYLSSSFVNSQVDANKRIAELMATLQKKSSEPAPS